jgi:hypothetical protein
MKISKNKPQKITSDLDYQISELQKEFDRILLMDKITKAYTQQKTPKPPKN